MWTEVADSVPAQVTRTCDQTPLASVVDVVTFSATVCGLPAPASSWIWLVELRLITQPDGWPVRTTKPGPNRPTLLAGALLGLNHKLTDAGTLLIPCSGSDTVAGVTPLAEAVASEMAGAMKAPGATAALVQVIALALPPIIS